MKLFSNKDLKEIRESVHETISHGFGYYLKNVMFGILVSAALIIYNEPMILKNPALYFSTFHISSLYMVFVLFGIIILIYWLAVSISRDSKVQNDKELAKTIISEQKDDKKKEDAEHNEYIIKRIKSAPEISSLLKSLIINLSASRVSILEMHNGSHNINGCPFIRATMNYEEISPAVDYVSEEFANFNLLKYPFISNHFDESIWIGTVDEIAEEDPQFAAKLAYGDDKYVCLHVLNGRYMPFGFLCISFSDDKYPGKDQIITEISKVSQSISSILDKG